MGRWSEDTEIVKKNKDNGTVVCNSAHKKELKAFWESDLEDLPLYVVSMCSMWHF